MKRALPGADEASSPSDAFSEVLQEAVKQLTVTNFSEAAAALNVSEEFIERGRKAAALRSSRRAENDYHILESWWITIPGSTTVQTRVMRALFLRLFSILLDEWLANAPLSLFTGCQKWLLNINYDSLADFQSAADGNELESTICTLLLDAACAVVRLYHPVTPKTLRQARGAESKRPRFEEKPASVTVQGNYIVRALRLDGVPEANKNRALKILLGLLRANVYGSLIFRPGFGLCLQEVGSYCLERCLIAPDELASDLYVLASWRTTRDSGGARVAQDCMERLCQAIERFVNSDELEAEEFSRAVDGALQLLASLYAFGSEPSSSNNLRILTLDLEMHFDILSRLTSLARENMVLYGIIFRHFTQLSRKLVQSQLLPLTQCVARILQRLCIDGQDASTLYTFLAYEDNFELFGRMVKMLPLGLWQHVMPRRPGVLSPSMSGSNQSRLTLADRLLHRLAGVLRRCADVLTGDTGRNVAVSLMRRTEEDEAILNAVLILLKSMRHLHQISSKCANETIETSILAVNWWLYNGLNADLAHDGLMLLKSANQLRLADTLLTQSLSDITARNLQRLTRLFAASEGMLLSELITTSLSLLNPGKESNVDPAYLEAFACVVKLWAQRLDTVKTAWQFKPSVRKAIATCQHNLRLVAAGVSAHADLSENLIGPRTANVVPSSDKTDETVMYKDATPGDSHLPPNASSLMSNSQAAKQQQQQHVTNYSIDGADDEDEVMIVDSGAQNVDYNPDLEPTGSENADQDDEELDPGDDEEPFEVYNGGAEADQRNSDENRISWG